MSKEALEFGRYKADLEYKKFKLGSVFVAITIVAIPPLFQLASAVLEYVKTEEQLKIDKQNKDADRAAGQQHFRDGYVNNFLNNALNQDIELRIRFAQYFAEVSDETYRESWKTYLKSLTDSKRDLRYKIDTMEAQWQQEAQSLKGNQSLKGDRSKLLEIERNLHWAYKEAGYLEENRSVASDPRASETPGQSGGVATNSSDAPGSIFDGDKEKFLSNLDQSILGILSNSQKTGIGAIVDYWQNKYHNSDAKMLAYILATAYFETNQTMMPMEELGKGQGKSYGSPNSDTGQIYYGRGFLQLTWAQNYRNIGQSIGIDLFHNPDLALDLNISASILVETMMRGLITGRSLSFYLGGSRADWINARRVTNGLFQAEVLANYAIAFYKALPTAPAGQ